MRKIKFRGKNISTNNWVYGDLIHMDCKTYIGYWISPSGHSYAESEVIRETVGQCTNLKDKNGVEIFEGDIITFDDTPYEVYQHECGDWKAGNKIIWEWINEDNTENEWEVIGNIYQNPELLEETEENE